jgi:hypothetical protein
VSEQHTYKISEVGWLCFNHCPFEDDCHPSSLRCPVLRYNKVKYAENEANKRGVSLLEIPSARALVESAGLEVSG